MKTCDVTTAFILNAGAENRSKDLSFCILPGIGVKNSRFEHLLLAIYLGIGPPYREVAGLDTLSRMGRALPCVMLHRGCRLAQCKCPGVRNSSSQLHGSYPHEIISLAFCHSPAPLSLHSGTGKDFREARYIPVKSDFLPCPDGERNHWHDERL